MDDLVQWLGAQLDEDERIARDAAKHAGAALATAASKDGVWKPPYDGPEWWNDYDHVFVVCDRPGQPRKVMIADCGHGAFMLTPHFAEHDPARVLREIAAKRLLIRELLEYEAQYDRDRGCGHSADDFALGVPHKAMEILGLRLIASVYSDRPGYRAEWRP